MPLRCVRYDYSFGEKKMGRLGFVALLWVYFGLCFEVMPSHFAY